MLSLFYLKLLGTRLYKISWTIFFVLFSGCSSRMELSGFFFLNEVSSDSKEKSLWVIIHFQILFFSDCSFCFLLATMTNCRRFSLFSSKILRPSSSPFFSPSSAARSPFSKINQARRKKGTTKEAKGTSLAQNETCLEQLSEEKIQLSMLKKKAK